MSDASLFSFFFSLAHKNQFLDWLIIFFAEYLIFILAIIAAILILKEKDWHRRFYFAALAIISTILSRAVFTEIIQFYYYHPRPFAAADISPLINHAATSSFPSGHMAFFSIVLTVWLINRRIGAWFAAGAFLVGVSRIAAGIHWFTDILGGIFVGALGFFIIYYLLKLKGATPNGRAGRQS